MPFALPVVPDVNAMSTGSSAAVSQFVERAPASPTIMASSEPALVGREVDRAPTAAAPAPRLLHCGLALGREPRVG